MGYQLVNLLVRHFAAALKFGRDPVHELALIFPIQGQLK